MHWNFKENFTAFQFKFLKQIRDYGDRRKLTRSSNCIVSTIVGYSDCVNYEMITNIFNGDRNVIYSFY